MSSNGGNKKSMDDVLSSIRRIIGTEGREDGGGEAPRAAEEPPKGDLPPLRLGDPVAEPGDADDRQPPALSLNPGMRADTPDDEAPDAPLSLGQYAATPERSEDLEPAAGPAPVEPGPLEPAAAAPVGETEDDAVVLDEAALEDMIRRIVREEMAESQPAAASPAGPDEETVRRILREEAPAGPDEEVMRRIAREEAPAAPAGPDEETVRRIAREEAPAAPAGPDEETVRRIAREEAPAAPAGLDEDTVRRIARDELAAQAPAAPAGPDEDAVRRIAGETVRDALVEDGETEARMRRVVQDELTGETGEAISRNVQQLIRVELERLLRERGL